MVVCHTESEGLLTRLFWHRLGLPPALCSTQLEATTNTNSTTMYSSYPWRGWGQAFRWRPLQKSFWEETSSPWAVTTFGRPERDSMTPYKTHTWEIKMSYYCLLEKAGWWFQPLLVFVNLWEDISTWPILMKFTDKNSTYYITILEYIEYPLISLVNDVSTIFSVEDGPILYSFSILWMVVDM